MTVENPGTADQVIRSSYSLAGQVIAVRKTGMEWRDDFNDGNAAGWTAHNGSWSIVSTTGGGMPTASRAAAAATTTATHSAGPGR